MQVTVKDSENALGSGMLHSSQSAIKTWLSIGRRIPETWRQCGVVSKNDKDQCMADGDRKAGKGENCRRGDLK